MKYQYLVLLMAAFMSVTAYVNAEVSPYVGKEGQVIKALSEERVQQFLNGDGMGFALSAELNQYPGPKHVIELHDQLSLTNVQLKETKSLYSQMNLEAKVLGADLIENERNLESLFRSGKITPVQIEESVSVIFGLQTKLRSLHLIAHIQQKALLSTEQQNLYQRLRGYGLNKSKHLEHKNHKH